MSMRSVNDIASRSAPHLPSLQDDINGCVSSFPVYRPPNSSEEAERPAFDVILTAMGAPSIDDFKNNTTSFSALFYVHFDLQLSDFLFSTKTEKSVKSDVSDEAKPWVVANGKSSRIATASLRRICVRELDAQAMITCITIPNVRFFWQRSHFVFSESR